ncbi:von willebrand factor type A domain protein [Pelomyxa schiedti]|nr:von willebrand factor type A domain protein [Pelomyxa schiedti]
MTTATGRVIVVAGPPGAGKGTQCKLLAASHGLLHVSTGDIFRAAVSSRTSLGTRVEQYISRGDFVPDDLVVGLIKERLQMPDALTRGVLLDGFPRTMNQAKQLSSSVTVERVILLELEDDKCVQRALGRVLDPLTGAIYHTTFLPPPEGVKSRTVKRGYDNDASTVRVRLRAYREQLGVVLPFFGGKIQVVDASRSIDEVNAEVVACLTARLEPVPIPPTIPANTTSQRAQPKCSVCMMEAADFLVVPCGHQCGCEMCLNAIKYSSNECPICRRPIDTIVRVFACGIVDNSNVLQLADVEVSATVPTPTPALTASAPLFTAAPTLPSVPVYTTTSSSAANFSSLCTPTSPASIPKYAPSSDGWDDEDCSQPETPSLIQLTVAPCSDIAMINDSVNVAVTVKMPDLMTRLPIDICCVVDISGSMGEEATFQDENDETSKRKSGLSVLDLVKHAVKTVLHTLSPEDRVALVAFDDYAVTSFPLLEMSEDGRMCAILSLEELRPNGSTNIWEGLLAGMEALRAPATGNPRRKYLLLLTDGQPNINPPRGCIHELKTYKESHPDFNFQLNTFGFGYTLDSDLLTQIATEGGGTFSFIPDAKIIGTCFVNAVANALSSMTQNSCLHLMPKNGAVFSGPVLGEVPVTNAVWGKVITLGSLQYGQSRDVVCGLDLANISPGEVYLEAVLVYSNAEGKEQRAIVNGTSLMSTADSIAAYARNMLVTEGFEIVRHAVSGERAGQEQLTNLCSLVGAIEAISNDPRIVGIGADLRGRMNKALTTRERFNRWGKHYMRAIIRAHQMQICTNFMDPGLQLYGGKLFQQQRDQGGQIFITLEPPPPSIPKEEPEPVPPVPDPADFRTYSPTPVARDPTPPPMETYYAGGGGGCFGAQSEVFRVEPDGKKLIVPISELRKGDTVSVLDGTAKVLCLVEMKRPQKPLLRLGHSLLITGHHPVLENDGHWVCARNFKNSAVVPEEVPNPSGVVYNVILDRCHIILIGGLRCVTWGHGLSSDKVVAHSLFGTKKVVQQLGSMKGWKEGFVQVEGCMRNGVGEVVSLIQHL